MAETKQNEEPTELQKEKELNAKLNQRIGELQVQLQYMNNDLRKKEDQISKLIDTLHARTEY